MKAQRTKTRRSLLEMYNLGCWDTTGFVKKNVSDLQLKTNEHAKGNDLETPYSDGTLNFLNLRRKSWSLLGHSWNLPHFLWHCWHIHDPSLVTCSLTLSQNVPPVPQIPFMMQGYRWDVSYGAAWCYAEKSPSKNVTCSTFYSKNFQETKIKNQKIQNL